MPTYEYACEKCQSEFEVDQRITDPPLKSCPKCRSRKVKRLISRTSFVLKGGGWYSDLYGSSGKTESSKEGSDSSTGDSKGDSKSDAKPDTKPDTKGPGDGGGSKSADTKASGKGGSKGGSGAKAAA